MNGIKLLGVHFIQQYAKVMQYERNNFGLKEADVDEIFSSRSVNSAMNLN